VADPETLPAELSWHPREPLTVVIAEADAVELAEKLVSDQWWRVDDLLSVNGIHVISRTGVVYPTVFHDGRWWPVGCGGRCYL